MKIDNKANNTRASKLASAHAQVFMFQPRGSEPPIQQLQTAVLGAPPLPLPFTPLSAPVPSHPRAPPSVRPPTTDDHPLISLFVVALVVGCQGPFPTELNCLVPSPDGKWIAVAADALELYLVRPP
jgi:hypothetical protein